METHPEMADQGQKKIMIERRYKRQNDGVLSRKLLPPIVRKLQVPMTAMVQMGIATTGKISYVWIERAFKINKHRNLPVMLYETCWIMWPSKHLEN